MPERIPFENKELIVEASGIASLSLHLSIDTLLFTQVLWEEVGVDYLIKRLMQPIIIKITHDAWLIRKVAIQCLWLLDFVSLKVLFIFLFKSVLIKAYHLNLREIGVDALHGVRSDLKNSWYMEYIVNHFLHLLYR
jgi:hypothetical protein